MAIQALFKTLLISISIQSPCSCIVFHHHHYELSGPYDPTRRSLIFSLSFSTLVPPILSSDAAFALSPTSSTENIINTLQEASNTLQTLLDNWDKATIDCTYADVPRELLETKNKDLLIEKAATSALFDKSTSVVTCKMNNRIVRDYIGVTGKGPMAGLDKKLMSPQILDFIDPDQFEEYDMAVERFIQAIAKASSSSYAAGSADLDSINNFSKEKQKNSIQEGTNLQQTKLAVIQARDGLVQILKLISVE